jgi:hypothetical protein
LPPIWNEDFRHSIMPLRTWHVVLAPCALLVRKNTVPPVLAFSYGTPRTRG